MRREINESLRSTSREGAVTLPVPFFLLTRRVCCGNVVLGVVFAVVFLTFLLFPWSVRFTTGGNGLGCNTTQRNTLFSPKQGLSVSNNPNVVSW